jgi:hypothetical protein
VGKGLKSDVYLRRALGTISKFVLSEYPEKKGNTLVSLFARQVEELTGRLHTILRDSIKINQHSADPEMMADLYFRIAKVMTCKFGMLISIQRGTQMHQISELPGLKV